MKKLILLTLLIFYCQYSIASHAVGAELIYECQGNGVYKFKFIFYRDCFGIAAPTQVSMNIENSCGFPDQSILLNLVTGTPEEIIPNCGQLSTCNGGTAPGIQKYIYEGIFVAQAECEYTCGVMIPGRTSSITMPPGGPPGYNLYVNASLSVRNNLCDNSPVFNNNPVMFTCVNQNSCLDVSATDPDGDSLEYSLISMETGPNELIPYDQGFSPTYPINLAQPLVINSKGIMCLTPTQPQFGTYVVLVNEFRNGLLIGQIKRDIEIYSIICPSSQPTISGINGGNSFNVTACALTPVCFNIYSADYNQADSTNMSWDESIANASFVVSDVQNDSAYFCWVPVMSDISATPYCFNVKVIDNSCPVHQTNSINFCITVTDPGLGACSIVSTNKLDEGENSLTIFPQPAKNIINLYFGNNINNKKTIRIENYLGKLIYQNKITENILRLECDNYFSNGFYIATIFDYAGNIVNKEKFMIINE